MRERGILQRCVGRKPLPHPPPPLPPASRQLLVCNDENTEKAYGEKERTWGLGDAERIHFPFIADFEMELVYIPSSCRLCILFISSINLDVTASKYKLLRGTSASSYAEPCIWRRGGGGGRKNAGNKEKGRVHVKKE